MKKKINEHDIFKKFHKYTYNDIKKEDQAVHDLVMQAIHEDVCKQLLVSEGMLVYMTNILEYISYNSIPVRFKFNLENILGSGEVVAKNNGGYVLLDILYYKKKEVLYNRHYKIECNEGEVGAVTYDTYPTIKVDNELYILYPSI